MTELALKAIRGLPSLKLDRVWLAIAVILALVAILDPAGLADRIAFAGAALAGTMPYVVLACLLIGYLAASGAQAVVAKAFEGRETRMIFVAAFVGALAPFCSCEVIPLVAALLAAGAPIAAVMAFWLASPVMDPAQLLITAAALGWPFAIGKGIAAIAVGLAGGFAMRALGRAGAFADPLKPRSSGGCCGCGPGPLDGRPVWRFWGEIERRSVFFKESGANFLFLVKWMALAYLLESLMVAYLPADAIASVVGGEGVGSVVVGALVGAPAYLNGYAAPPLVAGLIDQGMGIGAAMAFIVAGAMTSVPAMAAVWALVKPKVFAAYLCFAFSGAMLMGLAYGWSGFGAN